MNFTMKAGLASAALAVAACFAPVQAADLGGGYGHGSIKDGYAPAPVAMASPVGPCYFRADLGYSWSTKPGTEWVGNAAGQQVDAASLSDAGLIEGGLGCAMGSRGFRAEMMLGVRQQKSFKGDVQVVVTPPAGVPMVVDPLMQTTVRTQTLMFNAYHDLGKFNGFVPYLGAGIGFAHHQMGGVTIADSNTPNTIFGDEKLSFAWSIMAGVGYQISDRAILDIGYRFIDMGVARSTNYDSALAYDPRLEITERAHEFKVGLRYHFGSDCCSQTAYAPMK